MDYYPNWDKLIQYEAGVYKRGGSFIKEGSAEERLLATIGDIDLQKVEEEKELFLKSCKKEGVNKCRTAFVASIVV